MESLSLDVSRPYNLVEIYDKSTRKLKYKFSINKFSEIERDQKLTSRNALAEFSDIYILDAFTESRLEPPMNV